MGDWAKTGGQKQMLARAQLYQPFLLAYLGWVHGEEQAGSTQAGAGMLREGAMDTLQPTRALTVPEHCTLQLNSPYCLVLHLLSPLWRLSLAFPEGSANCQPSPSLLTL